MSQFQLYTINAGLSLIFDALNILHLMHHEATACHVTQVNLSQFAKNKVLVLVIIKQK